MSRNFAWLSTGHRRPAVRLVKEIGTGIITDLTLSYPPGGSPLGVQMVKNGGIQRTVSICIVRSTRTLSLGSLENSAKNWTTPLIKSHLEQTSTDFQHLFLGCSMGCCRGVVGVFSTKPIVSRCSASGPGQEGLLSNEKGSILRVSCTVCMSTQNVSFRKVARLEFSFLS